VELLEEPEDAVAILLVDPDAVVLDEEAHAGRAALRADADVGLGPGRHELEGVREKVDSDEFEASFVGPNRGKVRRYLHPGAPSEDFVR
jgi:hypothetical protein